MLPFNSLPPCIHKSICIKELSLAISSSFQELSNGIWHAHVPHPPPFLAECVLSGHPCMPVRIYPRILAGNLCRGSLRRSALSSLHLACKNSLLDMTSQRESPNVVSKEKMVDAECKIFFFWKNLDIVPWIGVGIDSWIVFLWSLSQKELVLEV